MENRYISNWRHTRFQWNIKTILHWYHTRIIWYIKISPVPRWKIITLLKIKLSEKYYTDLKEHTSL